jgi:bifunctional non-homologous end joining protein LigD
VAAQVAAVRSVESRSASLCLSSKGLYPIAWLHNRDVTERKKAPGPAEKLTTYRAKRNPAKTPEPMGPEQPGEPPKTRRGKRTALRFVIQEHHARALHWDLRLEHGGVFVSWALPKGLPDSPSTNHLAVHTEDHPLQYGKFEGEIPKGEYGGGNVSIWDQGTYELEKWEDKEVKVVFHGKRASGRYVLFPTDGKNWMIHRMDPPPRGFEAMPRSIAPMLAVLSAEPPQGDGWAYEFKWDGVRAIVFVDGGRVRATSRNDKDLTAAFPELRPLGEFLGSRSAILDGELVAFDDDGRPSFGRLQHRLHVGSRSEVTRRSHDVAASFLAFDLLYLEGRSLLTLGYDERRALLESLDLKGESFATPPSFTESSAGDVLETARERRLEGIVAKRRSSPYVQGSRNGNWVKVKNFRTQEVVIGGWTTGKGSLSGSLGALLVGIPSPEGLVYAGKVGTGFDASARQELLRALEPLSTKTSPFAGHLPKAQVADAHFTSPELVGEVQYGEWTADGHLRHTSWRGLRLDKVADEVVREE